MRSAPLSLPPLGPDAIARYQLVATAAGGRRVLDAATGTGAGALLLREAGARTVVGIDEDEEALAEARERHAGPGLRFQRDDCETLARTKGPFDLVCSLETIEQLDHPERFVAVAARRLARGGRFVCSVADAAGPINRQLAAALGRQFVPWDRDRLLALLTRVFAAVELRAQVMSHEALGRREAIAALASQAGRKRTGTARLLPALARLVAPGPADFPIVSERAAPLFGAPHALLALCGRLRRR